MAFYAVFKIDAVQTYLAKVLMNKVGAKYGFNLKVDRVSIDFPNTVSLKGIYIEDLEKDTLLFLTELNASIKLLRFSEQKYMLSKVELSNGLFNMNRKDVTAPSNLMALLHVFKTDDSKEGVKPKLELLVDEFSLENIEYRYIEEQENISDEFGTIDFKNINLTETNVELENVFYCLDSIYSDVAEIQFKEKNGFEVKHFASVFSLSESTIKNKKVKLETSNSKLRFDEFYLLANEWSDYSSFVTKVKMKAAFKSSRVAISDISYFTNTFIPNSIIQINSGLFSGKISAFRFLNFDLRTNELAYSQSAKGSVVVDGLPEIETAFIDASKLEISTSLAAVNHILNGQLTDKVPQQINSSEQLTFKGNYTGFIDNFVAYGEFGSPQGVINTDLKFNTTLANQVLFSGTINTDKFDFGNFVKVPDIGSFSANLELNGSGNTDEISATVIGVVSEFEYQKYSYKNIKLEGKYSKGMYQGKMKIADPNLNLDFNGSINLAKKLKEVDFTTKIYALNLTKLNLVADTVNANITTTLIVKGKGHNLEDFTGVIKAQNTDVCVNDKALYLDKLLLKATLFPNKNREYILENDYVNGSINGDFKLFQMPDVLNNTLYYHFPEYFSFKTDTPEQDASFQFAISEISTLAELMGIPARSKSTLSLEGKIKSAEKGFRMKVLSSDFSWGNARLTSGDFLLESTPSKIEFTGYVDSLYLGKTFLTNVVTGVKQAGEIAQADVSWGDVLEENSGILYFLANKQNDASYKAELLPGELKLGGSKWILENSTELFISPDFFSFDGLVLKSGIQQLGLSGFLSEEESTLNFDLQAIRLAELDDFLPAGIKATGEISADGELKDIFTTPSMQLSLFGNRIMFNDKLLGDLRMSANWVDGYSQTKIDGWFEKYGNKHIAVNGTYSPFDTENTLDLNLSFNDFKLSFMDHLITEEVTDIDGTLQGSVKVFGELKNPTLKGRLNFENASFKINYLNTTYRLTEDLVLDEGYFGLNHVPLIDEFGQIAWVTATAFYDKGFTNFTYDVFCELDNFYVLNTIAESKEPYYGQGYLTGTANIEGYDDKTNLTLKAKAKKNTAISIPLDDNSVDKQKFVSFVSHKYVPVKIEKKKHKLTMRLELDVDEKTEVELVFDERTGDKLKGNGNGNLIFEIDQLGTFNMFGKYNVSEGVYNFTLQNVISKKFSIANGSSIKWFGDPYTADIDLKALYNLRAPLYDVMLVPDDRYKSKEDVVLALNLNDKLLQPTISFDISIPNADDFSKGQLKASVDTQQELNRQAFSLLMFGRFIATENKLRNTVPGASDELAYTTSSVLSTVFSQVSTSVDVGVNITTQDELANRERSVNLRKQFNDRLTLAGGVGVQENVSSNKSNFIGDFSLEYALTDDGRLRLKAFNETADNAYLNSNLSPYIQGIGVSYHEDFDTIGELYRRFLQVFERKSNRTEYFQDDSTLDKELFTPKGR